MDLMLASAMASDRTGPDHAAVTVAICDDVREFRELMRFGLEADPRIEVVGEAADGEEAVAVVGDLLPRVALLDLSMPRLDGLQVIDALRQRSPGTRIVVLSGLSASRMESEVIERGASRYLEQGASLVDIRAAIHQAAGGGE